MGRAASGIGAGAVGVGAALVWQLGAEVQYALSTAAVETGVALDLLPWLPPPGSSFPLALVPQLVPNAAGYVLSALLTAALVGLGVAAGVRAVLRSGDEPVRTFLAVWMVVVLVGVVAAALSGLLGLLADGSVTMIATSWWRGAGWGLATGWLASLAVMLGERRRRQA